MPLLRRAFLVLAATLVAAACGTVQLDADSRIGQKAPDFTLPDIDGRSISLSRYQGKVVVLDFWASWCAPCIRELPVYQDLHDKYRDRGFEMIGVNVADENPDIAGFLRKKEIRFTNLIGDDEIQELYGPINGFPTTFIIDRQGVIRDQFIGGRPRETLEDAIQSLL